MDPKILFEVNDRKDGLPGTQMRIMYDFFSVEGIGHDIKYATEALRAQLDATAVQAFTRDMEIRGYIALEKQAVSA